MEIQPFSTMNESKLLKEYMLLTKVLENLESLLIYNPELAPSIQEVDADLKKIRGQLFFRYKDHKRINLENVVITGSDLQMRMEKYLYRNTD